MLQLSASIRRTRPALFACLLYGAALASLASGAAT